MRMLSRLSLTAYGGIGVITPTDGVAIIIMVGEVTRLITATVAGPMVGAASTVAGDVATITIITILAVAGIPVAVDTGEVVIGIAVAYIRIDVMMEHVIPTEIVSLLHKELHVGVL